LCYSCSENGEAIVVDVADNSPNMLAEACSIPAVIEHGIEQEESTKNLELPVCWSSDQYPYFKSNNKWLYINCGTLGCSTCKEVKNLGTIGHVGSSRAYLSEEWINGKVGFYGNTKAAQQTSLRKKIYEHRVSNSHKSAEQLLESQKQELLQAAIATQTSEQHLETSNVFRTAYSNAKSDRPYSDHPDLIELQELNSIDAGHVLHGTTTCTSIIDHISSEMKKTLTKKY